MVEISAQGIANHSHSIVAGGLPEQICQAGQSSLAELPGVEISSNGAVGNRSHAIGLFLVEGRGNGRCRQQDFRHGVACAQFGQQWGQQQRVAGHWG